MQPKVPGLIRPIINGEAKYARILIRRKTPEEILYGRPIEDADDLNDRLKLIVDWYRGIGLKNKDGGVMLEFTATYLTDEELDALEAEDIDD